MGTNSRRLSNPTRKQKFLWFRFLFRSIALIEIFQNVQNIHYKEAGVPGEGGGDVSCRYGALAVFFFPQALSVILFVQLKRNDFC